MKYFYSVVLYLFLTITVLLSTLVSSSLAQDFEFKTDGLYNAELFDNIYRGHFENIKMNREDLNFLGILNQYLRAFGQQCPDYLPADKVMIMDTECARERVEYNGYGAEINRYCIEWRKVPSNIYARPDLYNAYLELERLQSANVLQNLASMMTDQNAIGNSVDKAHKAKALMFDMGEIFQLNTCNSQGIQRFEENLKRFALNQQSIRMEGVSKYTAMKKSGGPSGSQDFKKLIDDLVSDQARTWMFNRYSQGSISAVNILSQDSQGRPTALKANYRYSGFGGSSEGWVKITFSNGLPEGIYFFDFPNNRKQPSSSVVASYAQGEYRK